MNWRINFFTLILICLVGCGTSDTGQRLPHDGSVRSANYPGPITTQQEAGTPIIHGRTPVESYPAPVGPDVTPIGPPATPSGLAADAPRGTPGTPHRRPISSVVGVVADMNGQIVLLIPGYDAAKVGIEVGDTIVQVDDYRFVPGSAETIDQIRSYMVNKYPDGGGTVEMTVRRGDRDLVFTIGFKKVGKAVLDMKNIPDGVNIY